MGATRGLSGLWGVTRTSALHSGSDLRALSAALSGLVTVGVAPPEIRSVSVPVPPDATAGRCLAAGMRVLPASAVGVVWCDGRAGDAQVVAELWDGIGAADAAVIADPVTDAIKRVAGGRIRGVVPRERLCVPTPPLVARIDAARRLLPALDAGHDPIRALAVAGLVVHVVLRKAASTSESSRVAR